MTWKEVATFWLQVAGCVLLGFAGLVLMALIIKAWGGLY